MRTEAARRQSKADIHVHTMYSHALMSSEELLEYVLRRTTLRLVAITDHNTIQGALDGRAYLEKRGFRDRLDIIVGSEIRSADGHILGLFLQEDVPPMLPAEETIAAIHEQEGLAVGAHPFTHWFSRWGMVGLGSKIRHLDLDAVEARNSSLTEIYSNLITKILNSCWQSLPETGGSDAYTLPMVGKAYTVFNGETSRDLYESIVSGDCYTAGSVCGPWTMLDLLVRRPPARRRVDT